MGLRYYWSTTRKRSDNQPTYSSSGSRAQSLCILATFFSSFIGGTCTAGMRTEILEAWTCEDFCGVQWMKIFGTIDDPGRVVSSGRILMVQHTFHTLIARG